MAIIDHEDLMAQKGATDETMPLRVVPDGGFREDIARSEVLEYRPPRERPETFHKSERRFRWAGPFPVRPVPTLGGRLSIKNPPLADVPSREEYAAEVEKFAREAPIQDVVEAVVTLSQPEGVEQSEESFDDTTETFALPAVWKMTGKPSANKLAHRSAAHVQRLFRDAGWDVTVWYGEATRQYWVMDEAGLHEFDSLTDMYQGMGWEAL